MSDRLAEIEAAVEITLRRARDSAGSQPEFVVAPNSVSCADVLALVEIAKAARDIPDMDTPETDALYRALARLDSGAAEGGRVSGYARECMDCGYDEFNCRCDDEELDDWDCTHCRGDGICDAGYDDIGGSCPSEAHYCHACKGTGRRRDQVIF